MSVACEHHCGFTFYRIDESRIWRERLGDTRVVLAITDYDFGCQVALMVDGKKIAKVYGSDHGATVSRCLREVAEVADNLRRYVSKT